MDTRRLKPRVTSVRPVSLWIQHVHLGVLQSRPTPDSVGHGSGSGSSTASPSGLIRHGGLVRRSGRPRLGVDGETSRVEEGKRLRDTDAETTNTPGDRKTVPRSTWTMWTSPHVYLGPPVRTPGTYPS